VELFHKWHLRRKSSSDTANSDRTDMPAFHCMSARKSAFSSDSVNSVGNAELDTLNDAMSTLSCSVLIIIGYARPYYGSHLTRIMPKKTITYHIELFDRSS